MTKRTKITLILTDSKNQKNRKREKRIIKNDNGYKGDIIKRESTHTNDYIKMSNQTFH